MTMLSLEAVRAPAELDELRAQVREFVAAEIANGRFTPQVNSWQTQWTRISAGGSAPAGGSA